MVAEEFEAEVRRQDTVWSVLAPPLRPSDADLEWFARGWPAGGGQRVLIQGSTPELLDLAVRKQARRIIAMDWHEPLFRAMQKLAREDWGRVEYLPCDWRVFVPDLEGTMDLVLGDGTLTMLAFPSEWEKVLRDLHRYLVPGGRLIFRLPFQPDEPLDLEHYLQGVVSLVDSKSGAADSEQRFPLLRSIISELRIAFGVASAALNGTVERMRRAELVDSFHAEFTARCGHWNEWASAREAMPTKAGVLKGKNEGGQAFPFWRPALDIVKQCGFDVKQTSWSGNRPAPGVMRFILADRI